MAFDNLKKNSGNALAKLQQKVNESSGGKKDPRIWKIPYDSNKVGTALIRLLPWGDGQRAPWVEWAEYSFRGKGGTYWNRSLKSIGKDDPVAELNNAQWNLAREKGEDNQKWKGPESNSVKGRGERTYYMCNIFVLEDNMNPENVGQVKLFKYGPGIHKKIMAALVPEYKDQSPIQVFDFWEGANFRVRSKGKQAGDQLLPNYEDSAFMSPEPLHSSDDVLKGIYGKMIDLTEFEAESNYKSFEDLKKDMMKVIGPREVARIMGEDFNPAMAEAAGSNPFPEAGGGSAGQGSDPFANSTQNQANQQQQAPQQADPFANAGQAQGNDPFASAAQGGDAGNDPFAGVGGDAGNDPFASQQQQEPQQQQQEPQQQAPADADPFANAGGDPFASTGGDAQQQQQAPSDDPFANISL